MKTKKIFLLISMLYTAFFIPFFIVKYGMLDSISESAKYLTPDNLDILFFLFVYILSGSVIWASQSFLGTYAGILLIGVNLLDVMGVSISLIIGIIGYAPIILNEVFLALWFIFRGFNLKTKKK